MCIWLAMLYLPVICGLTTHAPNSNSDHDLGSLRNHITKLEETVATLQSQAQTQEQKYAAVLSNVLSKLTSTTDELSKLQSSHKITEDKLESVTSRLTSAEEKLKHCTEYVNATESNQTLLHSLYSQLIQNNSAFQLETKDFLKTVVPEVAELEYQLNSTQVDLQGVKASLESVYSNHSSLTSEILTMGGNINEISGKLSGILQINNSFTALKSAIKLNYAFETQRSNLPTDGLFTVSANETIPFGPARVNIGSRYDSSTGMFTARLSGTYLFWVNAVFNESTDGQTVIRIEAPDRILESSVGRTTSTQGTIAVNLVTVVLMKPGETVRCSPTMQTTFYGSLSSFGGVLLHLTADRF